MKGGGPFLWNAIAIFEMSKTTWQRKKLLIKDDLEKLFKRPIMLFGAMVEYHPISPRDQSRLHQFGKKVVPGIFFW